MFFFHFLHDKCVCWMVMCVFDVCMWFVKYLFFIISLLLLSSFQRPTTCECCFLSSQFTSSFIHSYQFFQAVSRTLFFFQYMEFFDSMMMMMMMQSKNTDVEFLKTKQNEIKNTYTRHTHTQDVYKFIYLLVMIMLCLLKFKLWWWWWWWNWKIIVCVERKGISIRIFWLKMNHQCMNHFWKMKKERWNDFLDKPIMIIISNNQYSNDDDYNLITEWGKSEGRNKQGEETNRMNHQQTVKSILLWFWFLICDSCIWEIWIDHAWKFDIFFLDFFCYRV